MNALPVSITQVRSESDIALVESFSSSTPTSIGIDLEYQGFSAELAGLPGKYASPSGELLIAWVNGEAGGCVALRALDRATLEMKRLYVRPAARGIGLGKRLVEAAISSARQQRLRGIAPGHPCDHGPGAGTVPLTGLRRDSALRSGSCARHLFLWTVVNGLKASPYAKPGTRNFHDVAIRAGAGRAAGQRRAAEAGVSGIHHRQAFRLCRPRRGRAAAVRGVSAARARYLPGVERRIPVVEESAVGRVHRIHERHAAAAHGPHGRLRGLDCACRPARLREVRGERSHAAS